jgi:hypothetical protein
MIHKNIQPGQIQAYVRRVHSYDLYRMLNKHHQLQKLTNSDVQLVQTYECLLEVTYKDLVKNSTKHFQGKHGDSSSQTKTNMRKTSAATTLCYSQSIRPSPSSWMPPEWLQLAAISPHWCIIGKCITICSKFQAKHL